MISYGSMLYQTSGDSCDSCSRLFMLLCLRSSCRWLMGFFVPFPRLQLMNAQPEKPFIRNKAAQVFALTFVMEYLTLWPKFFFDILSLVGLNPHGVDIYLRTLMAIDAEVVDRDILHSLEVRSSSSSSNSQASH